MKIIIGLGNPEARYENTRHNIGFQLVDHLAGEWSIPFRKRGRWSGGEGKIDRERVLLVKPLTYMNLSGKVIPILKRFFPFDPVKDLLVILDDTDLELGNIRFRERGSSGGHRGLASFIEEIGSEQFSRLRMGIGRPSSGETLENFVLTPFTSEEKSRRIELLNCAKEACLAWLRQGAEAVMQKFNKKNSVTKS